jgi:hypothetical protein
MSHNKATSGAENLYKPLSGKSVANRGPLIAETGKNATAWKELERDFAVIYDGVGQSIVSSRRWEAWRMGVEDYELLKMYAVKKGSGAAKAMAKTVLDHPEDTSKADQMRQTILTELSHE